MAGTHTLDLTARHLEGGLLRLHRKTVLFRGFDPSFHTVRLR